MSGVWPDNYINKAEKLEITEGIKLKAYDSVPYNTAALMAERALMTTPKGGAKLLGEVAGLGYGKSGIVVGSNELDNTLTSSTIKMDIGEFRNTIIDGKEYFGRRLDILVDSNNEILAFRWDAE
jgi:hypothetical protein